LKPIRDHHHSPVCGDTPWGKLPLPERGQVGPNAVLGGLVLDPSGVPFLLPAEEPVVFPKFASARGLAGVIDGHDETRRKLGNVRHSTGEIRHEQR
jgi:hypothetical protein